MGINRNTFEANFRFNRLVSLLEEANTEDIFKRRKKVRNFYGRNSPTIGTVIQNC